MGWHVDDRSLRRHYPDQVQRVEGCLPSSQPGVPGSPNGLNMCKYSPARSACQDKEMRSGIPMPNCSACPVRRNRLRLTKNRC